MILKTLFLFEKQKITKTIHHIGVLEYVLPANNEKSNF